MLINNYVYLTLQNVGRLPWQYDDVFHPELQTAEATI